MLRTILSNESWDVARALVVLSGQRQHPLYPLEGEGAEVRRAEIDQLARTIHDDFNNGRIVEIPLSHALQEYTALAWPRHKVPTSKR